VTITWADLEVGKIIRYEHRNRSQRLAGRRPVVRLGRLEAVYPPAEKRHAQISITVLNKDRTPNRSLGRISIYSLDDVLSVEPGDADSAPHAEGGADRG
jgi:hypothetical protein